MNIKAYDEPLTPREKQSLKMDKAKKDAAIAKNNEMLKKFVQSNNKTVFVLTGESDG